MIKSKEIEKVYNFIKGTKGVSLTSAFNVDPDFEDDFEMIYGESEKGKCMLYEYDQFVFCVEYADGTATHWHPWEPEDAAIEVEKFIDENYRPVENLYCAYYYGDIVFPHNESYHSPDRNSDVFIIAQEKEVKTYGKTFAEKRIEEECKNFVCFGKYAAEKELALDMADIKIHGETEDIALTATEDNIDEFAESIYEAAKYSDDNVFLFYDDRKTYNKVKDILIKLKKAEKNKKRIKAFWKNIK